MTEWVQRGKVADSQECNTEAVLDAAALCAIELTKGMCVACCEARCSYHYCYYTLFQAERARCIERQATHQPKTCIEVPVVWQRAILCKPQGLLVGSLQPNALLSAGIDVSYASSNPHMHFRLAMPGREIYSLDLWRTAASCKPGMAAAPLFLSACCCRVSAPANHHTAHGAGVLIGDIMTFSEHHNR